MKVVALIPARYGSTRFPGKMLAMIRGKSLIRRTYESARNTGLFSQVIVVTDSDEIEQEVKSVGGEVLRSSNEHETGTDRIAEVAGNIDADVIINIQGDEPFMQHEPLARLIRLFEEDKSLPAGSLVLETRDEEIINNPNRVKVLLKPDGSAIYFSRSPVPYRRNMDINPVYYIHIGIYAFRKEALLQFASWKPSWLERVEQLECIRFVEYGMQIKLAVTQHVSVAVDTPEDLEKAEAYLDQNTIN